MPNWDEDMELNVSVLDRTHTQRGKQERRLDDAMADDTKSQHSTRCTEKRLKSQDT